MGAVRDREPLVACRVTPLGAQGHLHACGVG